MTIPVQGIQAPRKKRRRVFMWFFLVIQLIFVLWIVLGAINVHHSTACSADLTAQECASARDIGTTFGFGLVIALWAVVDVILGVTYAIVRWARR